MYCGLGMEYTMQCSSSYTLLSVCPSCVVATLSFTSRFTGRACPLVSSEPSRAAVAVCEQRLSSTSKQLSYASPSLLRAPSAPIILFLGNQSQWRRTFLCRGPPYFPKLLLSQPRLMCGRGMSRLLPTRHRPREVPSTEPWTKRCWCLVLELGHASESIFRTLRCTR
ncbi:uncharacterized protein M421DRAFT_260143 [Didymella exigua CBS 183.55]|uniref:Uncharacterized protein n=1 Tax=Didymella exigua CBS 183.55 TaxID=1150837 RepID=A0A6A5RDA2_9PLEO|nr:uncharacterized protein M421DRAFT_260143 [Didymella exigua CBS 183.55]KAF1925369.1 hypothetical protein M421DRAFT_260143 [Didymella exigua CBS 183.55]